MSFIKHMLIDMLMYLTHIYSFEEIKYNTKNIFFFLV